MEVHTSLALGAGHSKSGRHRSAISLADATIEPGSRSLAFNSKTKSRHHYETQSKERRPRLNPPPSPSLLYTSDTSSLLLVAPALLTHSVARLLL